MRPRGGGRRRGVPGIHERGSGGSTVKGRIGGLGGRKEGSSRGGDPRGGHREEGNFPGGDPKVGSAGWSP